MATTSINQILHNREYFDNPWNMYHDEYLTACNRVFYAFLFMILLIASVVSFGVFGLLFIPCAAITIMMFLPIDLLKDEVSIAFKDWISGKPFF